jgi:hypothetical protein
MVVALATSTLEASLTSLSVQDKRSTSLSALAAAAMDVADRLISTASLFQAVAVRGNPQSVTQLLAAVALLVAAAVLTAPTALRARAAAESAETLSRHSPCLLEAVTAAINQAEQQELAQQLQETVEPRMLAVTQVPVALAAAAADSQAHQVFNLDVAAAQAAAALSTSTIKI